jgi:nucleoid-associated protein YgaU
MRKDVRLGLAVGTFLFTGVMSYVLFFTGNPPAKNHSQANNTRVTPVEAGQANSGAKHEDAAAPSNVGVSRAPETTSTPPVPETAQVPATDLNANNNIITPSSPSTLSTETTTPPVAVANADSGAAVPVPAAPITSGGMPAAADWQSLLENGAPEAVHSATPAPHTATPAPEIHDAAPPVDPPLRTVLEAPTTRPANGMRQYTIKPGETFWSIAKAEYGNASYFSHIVRANPHINPSKIKAKMVINLPDKADVIPSASATVATSLTGPTTRPIDSSREYRVVSGDNLNTIAKKLYGTTTRAKQIYDLNKDLIGPNPNALKLNMVLKLPDTPAATASSTSEDAPTRE